MLHCKSIPQSETIRPKIKERVLNVICGLIRRMRMPSWLVELQHYRHRRLCNKFHIYLKLIRHLIPVNRSSRRSTRVMIILEQRLLSDEIAYRNNNLCGQNQSWCTNIKNHTTNLPSFKYTETCNNEVYLKKGYIITMRQYSNLRHVIIRLFCFCSVFSRHLGANVLPIRQTVQTWLLLQRWITLSSVSRFHGYECDAVRHRAFSSYMHGESILWLRSDCSLLTQHARSDLMILPL